MIIVRNEAGDYFYSASRKSVPSLVHEMTKGTHVEKTITECDYVEFNTTTQRTGLLTGWAPLSELVNVKVSLAPDVKEDEEEDENVQQ